LVGILEVLLHTHTHIHTGPVHARSDMSHKYPTSLSLSLSLCNKTSRTLSSNSSKVPTFFLASSDCRNHLRKAIMHVCLTRCMCMYTRRYA
jgi:hypothetical protein